MAEKTDFEIAVIGGGIVGVATAMALARKGCDSLVVLEKEAQLATHQTGHNSGVIHSGLYYRPDSLKARNCVVGREALYAFCAAEGIAHERCGKVVVATAENEVARLTELEKRGRANGLSGIARLDARQLRELEPNIAGVAGLHVPETGIVDYVAVTRAMARQVEALRGEIRTGCEVVGIAREGDRLVLRTGRGAVHCRFLVNCAGLFSDRIARLCGMAPEVAIVPFRGEYYRLRPAAAPLVRNLIYPVPDPAMPFLGVHLTRMVDGRVEAGPNAVLAWQREGYSRLSFSPRDAWEILAYPGFWRLARRFWRVGAREYLRSFSRRLFLADLRRLLPPLQLHDLGEPGAGVRAQAVSRAGDLLDDFHLCAGEGMVHVLNAPSPAATASLAIGRAIAEQVEKNV